jgi:hypothetical protein
LDCGKEEIETFRREGRESAGKEDKAVAVLDRGIRDPNRQIYMKILCRKSNKKGEIARNSSDSK